MTSPITLLLSTAAPDSRAAGGARWWCSRRAEGPNRGRRRSRPAPPRVKSGCLRRCRESVRAGAIDAPAVTNGPMTTTRARRDPRPRKRRDADGVPPLEPRWRLRAALTRAWAARLGAVRQVGPSIAVKQIHRPLGRRQARDGLARSTEPFQEPREARSPRRGTAADRRLQRGEQPRVSSHRPSAGLGHRATSGGANRAARRRRLRSAPSALRVGAVLPHRVARGRDVAARHVAGPSDPGGSPDTDAIGHGP